jgi:excinuclease ABC subunit C
MEDLERRFDLKRFPRRIECFDISNLMGREAVGSMVVFLEGEPFKDGYRRYRIRSVEGMDDYAMMYEVLRRRFSREKELPDLIVVDGGRGHLSVAQKVLKEMGIKDIDLLSLAKERCDEASRRERLLAGRKRGDRAYLPGRKLPVIVDSSSGAMRMLQWVRDEAHRFAVSYHRALRRKVKKESILLEIPGVGEKRRRALMERFRSVEGIRRASQHEIASIKGISREAAERILDHLKSKGPEY